MGFNATANKKRTGKPAATKSAYVNVGSVWTSRDHEGQFYITTSKDNAKSGYKAAGRLIYQDAATGKTYLVNSIYMFEPKKEVDGLAYNLALRLDNEKSVTELDAGSAAATGEDLGIEDSDYDADLDEDLE